MSGQPASVVATFQVRSYPGMRLLVVRDEVENALQIWAEEAGFKIGGLSVAVREVGAGGESSVMEGEGP